MSRSKWYRIATASSTLSTGMIVEHSGRVVERAIERR